MAQYTESLGGGTSDTGTSYFLSFSDTSDVTSPWQPSSSLLTSGAFASNGITASTVKPGRVVRLRLRLGGSYGGYSGNADVKLRISTNDDGSSGQIGSTYNQTGTTGTASSGTVSVPVVAGTTYYYGVRGQTNTGSVFFYAKGGSGSVIKDGVTDTTADELSGDIDVQSIPSAPGTPTASNITSTSMTLTWTAPSDNGGTSITGYRINYRVTGTSAWSVLVANTGTTTVSRTLTGLNRNTGYDFQIAALNGVTNAHNTDYSLITAHVGVRSGTVTATTLAGGPKVWDQSLNGGAGGWASSEIKVYDPTLNGGTGGWITGAQLKVWNGSGWSNIT